MYQQLVEYIKEKKVLILGFSREGRSTYNFIRRHLPEKELMIADIREVEAPDSKVKLFCGEDYLDAIGCADIVIKAPGVPLLHFEKPDGVEITCQTDLFLRFAPCKCIGVTGTKGKTTTSTIIYSMLTKGGLSACLIGNMGYPVFDSIEECEGETAVIEMSSHQLEFTTASPDIAVLTNVYPEHLDHYDSFEGYVNAKLNIVRHQNENGLFIYNSEQGVDDYLDLSALCGRTVGVSADDDGCEDFKDINKRLLGRHNLQNCMFAAVVAEALGVKRDDMIAAVRDYAGIEHRMEPVGTVNGIKFVNDCIATIPHSVLCAIDALGDVDTLIFGGMDRGLDYSEFEKELEKRPVRNLVCLPDTGHKIGMAMAQAGSEKNIVLAEDMEGAVRVAIAATKSGGTCLLSPAASSYNKYKNFEEKGRHFKALVQQYDLKSGENT